MRHPDARGAAAVLATVAFLAATVAFTEPGRSDTPARASGRGAASVVAATKPRRVLIFSVPHLRVADLDRRHMPVLTRFFDHAAVADLTTRSEEAETTLGDGYTTLGAGTRAVGDPVSDGDGFSVSEPFGTDTAGAVYRQRTGRDPGHGLVALGIARIIRANDELLYGAKVGVFGAALARAGYGRAVIANGDGRQPDTPIPISEEIPPIAEHRRQAVAGLMDPSGRVPGGQVDDRLLTDAPQAPFGVRLDPAAVLAAFDRAFTERSVVLVEASDLVRADAYRAYATARAARVQWNQARRASDRLFASLLQRVRPDDLVVVVGPAHPASQVALTVLGIRGPGFSPGLLRSPSTRRAGFVQMPDVAPTVLGALGVARPASMQGRAAELADTGGGGPARRAFLVRANEVSQFRDDRVGETHAVMVALVTALLVAGALGFGTGRAPRARARCRALARWLPLPMLGFVPATFLARLLPLDEAGAAGFWLFVTAAALVLGACYARVGRRYALDAVLAGLLVIFGLLSVDVVAGTPLTFNSPLGYSPTAGGRFSGLGNLAFAVYATSVLLAAVLVTHRFRGVSRVPNPLPRARAGALVPHRPAGEGRADERRAGAGVGTDAPRPAHHRWVSPEGRGELPALTMLAFAILVDGAPFLGADVGGVMSMVLAYVVTGVWLLGSGVRWRTVAWTIGGLVAAVGLFTGIDLLRPSDERTHLGRFVEQIHDQGLSELSLVIRRKLVHNVETIGTSMLGLVLLASALFVLWLVWKGRERAAATFDAVPEWRIGCAGFAVLAATGWAFNDSGITIPGAMLYVFVSTSVWLLAHGPETRARRPAVGETKTRADIAPAPVQS